MEGGQQRVATPEIDNEICIVALTNHLFHCRLGNIRNILSVMTYAEILNDFDITNSH